MFLAGWTNIGNFPLFRVLCPAIVSDMSTSQRSVNIELLLGVSATFLSLAALVVSVFQTRIDREQQYASVWPRLAIVREVMDRNFTISIANQGVGPAIVKSIDVEYRGKKYPNLSSLLFQTTGHLNGGYYSGDIGNEDVIKAADDVSLFMLVKNDEMLSNKLKDVVTDSLFHLRIRYADVYGNCWELDQNKVTAIGKCN